MRVLVLAAALLAVLSGCGNGGGEPSGTTAPGAPGFELSAAFGGQTIAALFTCDGDGVSPGLSWQGAPAGTQELALVFEDPDAPGGTFTHWLVYGVSPRTTSLPQGLPRQAKLEQPQLRQGRNDFGDVGYEGPCPPDGETHRYVLRLLALDSELGLEPAASRSAFESAIAGRVLAEARVASSYGR